MKKILQINSLFGTGSTGVLVKTLHQAYLDYGYESYVLYGRGDKTADKQIIKFTHSLEPKVNSVLSRLTGVMYGGCLFSTSRLISIIKRIGPDLVHIHCVNTFIANNYRLFKFLAKNKYKVLITLHAEYMYTGSCSHSLECNQWINGCKKCPTLKWSTRSIIFDRTSSSWKKMYNSITSIDVKSRKIVAVSDWLAKRAKQSKTFSKDVIYTINNGIDCSIFKKSEVFDDGLRKIAAFNKKMFLFVAPDFNPNSGDIKGCDYFLKIVESMSEEKDIYFIVIGRNKYHFDFSLFDNVSYLGEVLDQNKMAQLYSMCDATLILSRRETYSLVTAESLSCGTPIIGFYSGGPETIASNEHATFFKQGDIESLVNYIKHFEKIEFDVKDKYSNINMIQNYLKLVEELLN